MVAAEASRFDHGAEAVGHVPGALEEALYFLFGQDFRGRVISDGGYRTRNQAFRQRPAAAPTRWTRQWKSASSNAYTAEEDDFGDEVYNEQDFEEVFEEADWEDDGDSLAEDLAGSYEDFAGESTYLQDDEGEELYEEAFASYLDARRRFAEVKAGRGYYPVVALVDNPLATQAPVAPQIGKGKGGKGSSKKRGRREVFHKV